MKDVEQIINEAINRYEAKVFQALYEKFIGKEAHEIMLIMHELKEKANNKLTSKN